jgi:hypothetical protein
VRIEEKAEAWRKVVDVETAAQRPLDVLHTVVECEGQLLQCGRTRFANVIAGDGNWIEARRMARAELEGVDDQAH